MGVTIQFYCYVMVAHVAEDVEVVDLQQAAPEKLSNDGAASTHLPTSSNSRRDDQEENTPGNYFLLPLFENHI